MKHNPQYFEHTAMLAKKVVPMIDESHSSVYKAPPSSFDVF
jgi:hypothetical protein